MNPKYNPITRQAVFSRYKSGESVSNIVQNTGIPRSTVYNWLKEAKKP